MTPQPKTETTQTHSVETPHFYYGHPGILIREKLAQEGDKEIVVARTLCQLSVIPRQP